MTFRKTEYYLFPQTIEASEFVNELCAELTKSGTKHERTDSTASIILYVESPHMELEVKDGKAVLPSMEELLKRAEAKGRADAIDEFVKRLKSFDIAFTYIDKADEFRTAIDNFAEQIKEKKID